MLERGACQSPGRWFARWGARIRSIPGTTPFVPRERRGHRRGRVAGQHTRLSRARHRPRAVRRRGRSRRLPVSSGIGPGDGARSGVPRRPSTSLKGGPVAPYGAFAWTSGGAESGGARGTRPRRGPASATPPGSAPGPIARSGRPCASKRGWAGAAASLSVRGGLPRPCCDLRVLADQVRRRSRPRPRPPSDAGDVQRRAPRPVRKNAKDGASLRGRMTASSWTIGSRRPPPGNGRFSPDRRPRGPRRRRGRLGRARGGRYTRSSPNRSGRPSRHSAPRADTRRAVASA